MSTKEELRPAMLCIAEKIANTLVQLEEAKDPNSHCYCRSVWQLETDLKGLVTTYKGLMDLAEREE